MTDSNKAQEFLEDQIEEISAQIVELNRDIERRTEGLGEYIEHLISVGDFNKVRQVVTDIERVKMDMESKERLLTSIMDASDQI